MQREVLAAPHRELGAEHVEACDQHANTVATASNLAKPLSAQRKCEEVEAAKRQG